jgi:hypothetical protein
MSDSSSIAQTSSEAEEDFSSFSDLTTKSSSRGYKMRSSASINSMPQMKKSRNVHKAALQSPNRSMETSHFPINFKASDTSNGNRFVQQPYPASTKPIPYHLTHQMSAPALIISPMPSMMMQNTKPNYSASLSMPSTAGHVNQNPNQAIKAFFTSGPASSNEFPLVSFSLSLKSKLVE